LEDGEGDLGDGGGVELAIKSQEGRNGIEIRWSENGGAELEN